MIDKLLWYEIVIWRNSKYEKSRNFYVVVNVVVIEFLGFFIGGVEMFYNLIGGSVVLWDSSYFVKFKFILEV